MERGLLLVHDLLTLQIHTQYVNIITPLISPYWWAQGKQYVLLQLPIDLFTFYNKIHRKHLYIFWLEQYVFICNYNYQLIYLRFTIRRIVNICTLHSRCNLSFALTHGEQTNVVYSLSTSVVHSWGGAHTMPWTSVGVVSTLYRGLLFYLLEQYVFNDTHMCAGKLRHFLKGVQHKLNTQI